MDIAEIKRRHRGFLDQFEVMEKKGTQLEKLMEVYNELSEEYEVLESAYKGEVFVFLRSLLDDGVIKIMDRQVKDKTKFLKLTEHVCVEHMVEISTDQLPKSRDDLTWPLILLANQIIDETDTRILLNECHFYFENGVWQVIDLNPGGVPLIEAFAS